VNPGAAGRTGEADREEAICGRVSQRANFREAVGMSAPPDG
jgi:hypothetical protein